MTDFLDYMPPGELMCGLCQAKFDSNTVHACSPGSSRTIDPKSTRIAFIERKRETTKADLLAKFEDADWHGVADAAMDLRDIESELKGLRA